MTKQDENILCESCRQYYEVNLKDSDFCMICHHDIGEKVKNVEYFYKPPHYLRPIAKDAKVKDEYT